MLREESLIRTGGGATSDARWPIAFRWNVCNSACIAYGGNTFLRFRLVMDWAMEEVCRLHN